MKPVKQKQAEALARREERAKLTPQQQIAWLDQAGHAAVRERSRLKTLLLKKVDTKPAPIHPKHTRI